MARLRQLQIDEKRLRDFDKPAVAEIEFSIPDHFQGDGAEKEGSITDSPVWAKLLVTNLDHERQVPLELGVPFDSTHRYVIDLPPALRLESLPKDQAVQSAWGSFSLRINSDPAQPRKLELVFRTRLHRIRVEPAEFERFRQFHEKVMKNYRVWLTLKPTMDLADAAALEAVVAKTPQDTASAAVLVSLYCQNNQRADARRVLQQVGRVNPDNVELLELAVKAAADLEGQEKAYRKLVHKFPDALQYAVALGETLINRGDHAGARAVLEPITQKSNGSWCGSAHYQLARSYFKQNQAGEALRHFEAASQANPEMIASSAALQFKAEILRKLARPAEAAQAYRQALLLEPNSGESLHALTELELEAGNRARALDYLRRYTVVVATDADGLVKAADLHLRLKRYDDAFDLASRSRDIDFRGGAQAILGLVYLHRSDYEKALIHLERGTLEPRTLVGLIRANVALGRLAEAERQAARIDSLDRSSTALNQAFALTIALSQRRVLIENQITIPSAQATEWAAAIDTFVCSEHALVTGRPASEVDALLNAAFKDGVELGPAYGLRGSLALDRGRLTKAAEDAERAIALSPRDAVGYLVRGRVRLERLAAGALTDLGKAVKLSHSTNPVMLHWFAEALHRAGRIHDALAVQRLAFHLRPGDAEILEQLKRFENADRTAGPAATRDNLQNRN
jgi:tetratricopeptide (TPR) repeat protein